MAGREYHRMSNTNPISLYVSEAERNRLEREAEAADKSLSSYIMGHVRDEWDREDTEAAAARMDPEEKIELLVADAKDELTSIAEGIEEQQAAQRDMLAIAGKYPIANWEVMKYIDDPPESVRSDAIETAERRLRKPGEQEEPTDTADAPTDESPDSSEGIGAKFLRKRREE